MFLAKRRGLKKPYLKDLLAILGLIALALAIFGDCLFVPGDKVASSGSCDAFSYFAESRAFGFGQIHEGRIPLWNPYLFSGSPFLGNFQSALLYPVNLIYLVLPLAKAINVELAFHLALLAILMYCWGRFHKLTALGAFFGAVMVMFSSNYFLHVLAGHLSMLDALAWAPLVFLAADHLLARPRIAWAAVGALALTMQVLAGLPQVVFLTGFTVGVYCVLRLITARNRLKSLLALAGMAAVPLVLSAPQLWVGYETARECTREGGVSFWFAASYSLPPENLLMLLVPAFFGDFTHLTYWGKWGEWGYWEVSVFVGVVGLFMTIYGALKAKGLRLYCILMIAVLIVIALGLYTPFFNLLYTFVPGFNRFRCPARILFFAVLFMGLLAGAGLSRLQARSLVRFFPLIPAVLGLALIIVSSWFYRAYTPGAEAHTTWTSFITWVCEGSIPSDDLVSQSAGFNSRHCGEAAIICMVCACLFWLSPRSRWAIYCLVFLSVTELFIFARDHRESFHLSQIESPELCDFVESHAGDCIGRGYRVVDPAIYYNRLMLFGISRIWGYDPVMTGRYLNFMAFTQSQDVSEPEWGLDMKGFAYHPLLKLLRLKYAVPTKTTEMQTFDGNPLPRFLLVHEAEVVRKKDAEFARMEKADFDPTKTVILEQTPKPAPDPTGKGGIIDLVDEDVNGMKLRVNVTAPAVLLITDAYSSGWRVRPLEAGPQTEYQLLPADYVLRGIPLAAGQHYIAVEYAPKSFSIGMRIAIIATAIMAALAAYRIISGRRGQTNRATDS